MRAGTAFFMSLPALHLTLPLCTYQGIDLGSPNIFRSPASTRSSANSLKL